MALSVAKGFANYAAVGGQQVLQSHRDFQSVFKTQGDCQILFAALKAALWNQNDRAPPATAAQQGENDEAEA